jgi:hypothetical protein
MLKILKDLWRQINSLILARTEEKSLEEKVASRLFQDKSDEDRLLFYLRGIAFLLLFCIFINLKNRASTFFVKEAEGLSRDSSKRDFCTMAMNQMIRKKLSKKIITDGLYEMVVTDNYKNMMFEEGDSVGSVFSGEESCKVLVKTSDSIRSIDLFLTEGEDSEFHYQITKIRENELYEKES